MKINQSKVLIMLIFLALFSEATHGQNSKKSKKGLEKFKKMSLNGADPLDTVIGFILDIIEMGSGVLEMFMSIGRKKRSTLQDELSIEGR